MIKKLLVSALFAAAYSSFALADNTNATFKTFPLGKIEVTALYDRDNFLANDAKVLGVDVGAKEVAKVLAAAGAPTDKIKLSVDALLVKDGDKIILLDTGLGPAAQGQLPESLAKAGYKPEQITDVLITHVHGDHIGGLLTADGKSAFSKATVQIPAPDWEWLQTMPKMQALVDAIKPQVKTFQPGAPVLPGITSVSLPGHTPGHVGYQIVSDQQRLLNIGDSAHSAIVSLTRPEWAIAYDHDRAEGIANRKALLAKLAADRELIFAPHFPFPGIGHIVIEGDHYVFQPVK